MPMIETTTIRLTPAAAPARCRFRAEAVKNAVASSWSGEGPVAASMIVSAPASASSRPSPLTTSTPLERAIGTTSCPRCSRTSTRCDPSRPVAPVTAIFWFVCSVCMVFPFLAPSALFAVSLLRRTGPAQIDRGGWEDWTMRAGLALGRVRESPPVAWLRDVRERRRRIEWPENARRSTSGDRVAVVVVNHNTRARISELLFSLYRVLGRDQVARTVVVDNASKDGSLPVLEALSEAELIDLISNKRQRYHGSGLNQAVSWLASRQAGLPEAERIDYVWALDSDTLILRRDAVRDALEVFRRDRVAVIGQSWGERDGYEYLLPATLMFEPGLVWRHPVAPFSDDGNPERKLLETATDSGRRLVAFPFLHHSYVLHLGSGTMIEVASERTNRFHVWAQRDLAGRRHYTYTHHPLGPRIHAELRSAYEREIPDDTPEQLVRACLRDELIAVPEARPLPPAEVLQRLYDEGKDLAEYVLA